jgi:Derlin-2/3
MLGGGGDEGFGQLGQFPLEQWFFEMPPCTRYWTTATVITSILLQCKVITPFQLFYSWRAVYYKSQVRTARDGSRIALTIPSTGD